MALLGGLAIANFAAVNAVVDRARKARLHSQARLIGWLCGARLVVVLVVLFAVRGETRPDAPVAQFTFESLVLFAFADALVALGIAAATVGGLRRSTEP